MKLTCPSWLDDVAKEYFRRTAPHLRDRLDSTNIETFAVLCDVYSRMRQEPDNKLRKNFTDAFIRLCGQFGLTPKTAKQLGTKQVEADELGEIFD